MATITDDIGIWNQLGSTIAEKKKWLKLPQTATGGNPTIRVSFSCSNWAKLSSYVLIRPLYKTANSEQSGQTARIFPSETPVIIQMPIPDDLLARFITFRDFEIQKVGRWFKKIGVTPDAILEVRLEELWG